MTLSWNMNFYDVGNAFHIMIIIKLKHKYVVVENMKFNSSR